MQDKKNKYEACAVAYRAKVQPGAVISK